MLYSNEGVNAARWLAGGLTQWKGSSPCVARKAEAIERRAVSRWWRIGPSGPQAPANRGFPASASLTGANYSPERAAERQAPKRVISVTAVRTPRLRAQGKRLIVIPALPNSPVPRALPSGSPLAPPAEGPRGVAEERVPKLSRTRSPCHLCRLEEFRGATKCDLKVRPTDPNPRPLVVIAARSDSSFQ